MLISRYNENVLILGVPEDCVEGKDIYSGQYACPLCDEPFDDDVWEKYSVGVDASGGQARFRCPNDCEGVVSVNF